MSIIEHLVTAAGNPIVRITIGQFLDDEEDRFGECYECEDGYHHLCVGVPCECPCPIPPTKKE